MVFLKFRIRMASRFIAYLMQMDRMAMHKQATSAAGPGHGDEDRSVSFSTPRIFGKRLQRRPCQKVLFHDVWMHKNLQPACADI